MSRPARSFCFFFSLLGLFVAPVYADEPPPESESLMPDFYSDPSISTSKGYLGGAGSVTVDPFSGMASISTTDIVIPGNGGMDIVLTRSYNAPDPLESPDHSPVGLGWSLHFGYMEMAQPLKMCSKVYNAHTMDNPVFVRPDGASQLLALAYQYPAGGAVPTYVSADYSVLICPPEGGFYLMDAAGNRYDFSEPTAGRAGSTRWVVERVTDRNGNTLDIDYAASGIWESYGVVISSITASDGRTVGFKYAGLGSGAPQLSEIVVDEGTTYNRSWLFTYAAGDHPANPNIPYLKSVTNPESLLWQYNYWPYGADQAGAMAIREVINPNGGREELLYDLLQFDNTMVDYRKTSLVVKHTKTASPLDVQEWTYSYSPSNTGDVTTVTGPDGVRQFHHFGLMEAVPGTTWRIGTLKKMIFDPSDGAVRTETFEWEPNILSTEDYRRPRDYMLDYASPIDANYMVPRLKSKVVEIDNARYETHYLQYRFADAATAPVPVRVLETTSSSGFSGSRELHYGYASRPAKWLWSLKQSEFNADGEENVHRYWDYDANGNLIFDYDRGAEKHFAYDEIGNLAESWTGDNQATLHENYYRGTAARVVFPDGGIVRREINSQGLVTRETNQLDHVTTYSYDEIGRITGINPPIGASTVVAWTPTSMTVSHGGYVARTDFDGFGREKEVRHSGEPGLSIRLRSQHDYAGRVIEQTISHDEGTVSHAANYGYDSHGRLKSVSHPGGSRSYSYHGSRISLTDEEGNSRTTDHLSFGDISYGWPVSIAQDDSDPITIDRNQLGQITRVSQGGIDRIYSYNTIHALDRISEPETGIEQYRYDRSGNVVLTTKTDSITAPTFQSWILTEWDDLNRPTKVLDGRSWIDQSPFPDTYVQIAWTEDYDYDLAGQVTFSSRNEEKKAYTTGGSSNDEPFMTWTDSAVWAYTYYENGQVRTSNLRVGKHDFGLAYNYDERGSLSSITYPSGEVLDYLPNTYGWATKAGRYVDDIQYHPTGMPKRIQYSNGDRSNRTINSRLMLEQYDLISSSGLTFWKRALGYDGVGNVTSINAFSGTHNIAAEYDGSNRLTRAVGIWGEDIIAYDGIGNIQSYTRDGAATNYSYATNGVLQSVTGRVARSYGYDNTGAVDDIDGRPMLRNVDNKVWSLTDTYGEKTRMMYDANGWRVSSSTPYKKKYFVYGQSGKMLHLLDETGDKYTEFYYAAGDLVSRRDVSYDCSDDIDGDGIDHCKEREWGLDPYSGEDGAWDLDGDGASNYEEYVAGSDADRADTDWDGMPDGYEIANGLNPLVDDAAGDIDADGYTNLEEYEAGTDPNQPDPPKPVSNFRATSGDSAVQLNWVAGSVGAQHRVYYSAGVEPDLATAAYFNVQGDKFLHEGLVNGNRYYYVVTSVNSFGESTPSSVLAAYVGVPGWSSYNGDHVDASGNVYRIKAIENAVMLDVYPVGGGEATTIPLYTALEGSVVTIHEKKIGLGGHALVVFSQSLREGDLYVVRYSPEGGSLGASILRQAKGVSIDINERGEMAVAYMVWDSIVGRDLGWRYGYTPRVRAFMQSGSTYSGEIDLDPYDDIKIGSETIPHKTSIDISEEGDIGVAFYAMEWLSGQSAYQATPRIYYSRRNAGGSNYSRIVSVLDAVGGQDLRVNVSAVGPMLVTKIAEQSVSAIIQPSLDPIVFSSTSNMRLSEEGTLFSVEKGKSSIQVGVGSIGASSVSWANYSVGDRKASAVGVAVGQNDNAARVFWKDGTSKTRQSIFRNGVWEDEVAAGSPPELSQLPLEVSSMGGVRANNDGVIHAFIPHSGENHSPLVLADPQVAASEGQQITLSSSVHDVDQGDQLSVLWTQISGPAAVIADTTSTATMVTLPQVQQDVELMFEVRVTDSSGASSSASVSVNVTDVGASPLVDAGTDQSVDEGASVSLSGTASIDSGQIASVLWTQLSGPSVSIANAGTLQAAFTAPQVQGNQQLTFQLQATSDAGVVGTDTVTVTVTDLDPGDVTSPVVQHHIGTRKAKGKTYYTLLLTTNEPATLLYRFSAGLTPQETTVPSSSDPGWYEYSGSIEFLSGSGSKVIEYFGRDAFGNESLIQSTGEL